jgi:hypothetical protein
MALTMDQLNEAYKKMSIYGDTYGDIVAPMPVDNASGINNIPSGIELTTPINNIKPYLPVTNLGGDNDNNIFKSYSLYNDKFDPNNKRYMENQTGIAGILERLKNVDFKNILGNIPTPFNLAKKSLKFITERNEKIQQEKFQRERISAAAKVEQIRQAEENRKGLEQQKSIQAMNYAGNMAPDGNRAPRGDRGAAAAGMGGGSRQATSAGSTNSGRTDRGWGWAEGGYIRRPYGEGGIVTL